MSDISIKKVADIAGVSTATVSRCLNNPGRVSDATRLRVEAAILETGYTPNALARNFRRGRTNLILVVLSKVGDPFYADIMQGIRSTAVEMGYSIVIEETQLNAMTAEKVGAKLVSKQADGVILLCSLSPFGTDEIFRRSQRNFPIVLGFEPKESELSTFPRIHIDNTLAAKEATEFLLAQGHRRIGMITGTEVSGLSIDRESGYRAAMAEAAIDIADGWVVDGSLSISGAKLATRALLDHAQRPTAVFCATDEMAFGCLHEIKESGLRVPDDVSVLGFDDMRYARVADPPLSTISQPAVDIGRRVMLRLRAEIDNTAHDQRDTEIVPHRLVLRKSTAPPGA